MFEPAVGDSRWLIVGEAPGEEEDKAGRPFIGSSGKLLNRLLEQVGFKREQFHITNVFTRRPPDNDLRKHWTLTKTDLKKLGYTTTGRLPKLGNRYIHPEHEGEVARLHQEIEQLNPEFILMLGGTALWAVAGETSITQTRGTLMPLPSRGLAICRNDTTELLAKPPQVLLPSRTSSPNGPEGQVGRECSQPICPTSTHLTLRMAASWASSIASRWGLASFHPAMVLRQWSNLPLLWADLSKAQRFLRGQLPPPLSRRFWVDPTLAELGEVIEIFRSEPHRTLGVDIETDPRIDQITSISFGHETEAICIPFYNKATLPELCNYWPTAREEAEAWRWVMRYAALPNPKVGQNFLYDHQYLLQDLDIRVRHIDDDTAILHHSLQPELPKALGTLASLYLNEPAWKFMRHSTKDDNKADE
jgi:uracil-DNA glycosylase